ncbi:MAG: T9SS type A sorting domain-containing protein [candidate division WOR-3 bacterium]|nr:T9SS type A sorting domain-containing protein [candidate division WOR-3 bacterium]
MDSSQDCTVPYSDHYWGSGGLLTEVQESVIQLRPEIVVPNPTKLPLEISYFLPKGCFVTLELYDVMGRRIKTLFRGWQDEGSHPATFNGDCPEGVYFLRLTAGRRQTTKKIIILK